ncbi:MULTISPECIES: CopG family transcriptional regulator [unclassified Azospirillum]|uniref:ribbon-helix-helix domain-containing protein n=1 Tax=unclassified Azospirillum TaxID=2630922 RepID=UPI000B654015|nr:MULTISPECIES: CopG family transcriptional regulator [unclassified Azospirillum]SNT09702.1 Ribbon-helix-helix protein, copG family [Azospirillum sp. RU38E]SNT25247.1 Ribbon-helix-helix protein, copG family [Azospirillum sp. RU37A]
MKPRHHLYLDDELSTQLEALAAKPGTTKSAIVSDALRQYLTRRGASGIEEALRIRLDRQGRQLERIERDVQVLLESLALYVRYQLTVTAPVPEPDRAAHAVGKERFQKFIDQVGRQMAAPTRTLSASREGAA